MNDEIKEVIEWLEDEDIYVEDYGYKYKRISLRETKILLDCITNLQKQLEEYQKALDETMNEKIDLQQKYNYNVTKYEELLEKYFNTKHRIIEAISILNKRKEDVEDFSWVEMRRNSYYEECDEVINILKGDSDE